MSAVVLRAVAYALRIGQEPDFSGVTNGGRHDLGDEILAGIEACELIDAIEGEIFEAAGLDDNNPAHTAMSTAKVWELLVEHIGEVEGEADEATEQLFSVRSALIATGSLDPADTETDIGTLITVLFGR